MAYPWNHSHARPAWDHPRHPYPAAYESWARPAGPPAPYRPAPAPAPAYDYAYDFDTLAREEEEARLRLEAIQRRREAARLAAEQDRYERAEAYDRAERTYRAQRRACLAAQKAADAKAEQEAVRQALIREALARRQRAEAEAEAELQARLRAKQAAEREIRRKHKEYERIARERELHMREEVLRQLEAKRQLEEQRRAEEAARARPACPRARSSQSPFDTLFALIAPQLDDETPAKPACNQACALPAPAKPVAAPMEKKVTPAPTPKPADVDAAKDKKADNAAYGLPDGLNDLLSHFLGLRVEPTDKSTKPSPTDGDDPSKIVESLNNLLSQFGLVFEPEEQRTAEKPESAAETNKPAAASENSKIDAPPATVSATTTEKPQTEREADRSTTSSPFVHNLPDFLKYAFEAALNDQAPEACCRPQPAKLDKGKGVAEGEKKPRAEPAPAPAPVAAPVPAPESETKAPSPADSISKLKSIADDFARARDSFTFPERLVFGASSADPQHPPALLFNKTNSPYHAQTNKLLQLLLAADDVSSDGDKSVRQERKALVKALEKEIESLEQKRDQLWEEVRSQRERGEEVEEIESVSSGASVVDPIEHSERHEEHEEATPESPELVEKPVDETDAPAATETPAATNDKTVAESSDDATGFDVPATAEEDKPAATKPAAEQKDASPDVAQPVEPEHVEKSEPAPQGAQLERKQSRQATVEDEKQEDGYEIL